MLGRFSSLATRVAAGGAIGVCAWPVAAITLPFLPEPVRFVTAWAMFTFGPGIAIGGRVTRDLDALRRTIILLGIGSAATPVIIDLLGRAHLIPAFPYLAASLAGAGLAAWRDRPRSEGPQTARPDAMAATALCALAIALGIVVFWHRLVSSPSGILVFGEYDSADLGYYASEASEASHTVPPMAAYYSGHRLHAAYYPHLVLGMIHRFAGMPVLSMYYRYAWPTFLALGALTAFSLVRSVASRAIAVLSVVLILVGSDFSYLAAWFLPHRAVDWDYLLWPTNFLSPTMQVLHFSTWGPSLPVFFTTLFAIVQALQTRRWGWVVLSAMLIAVLFEFKPFAYAVLMAALGASAVFSGRDWTARFRLAATIGLGLVLTLPFLAGAASLDPSDRRTRLVFDAFLLPKRMLIKIDQTAAFAAAADYLAPTPSLRQPILYLLASVVFLAIGVGVRWVGARAVWRAVRARATPDAGPWRLFAWIVIAGVAIPFVIATDPYIDTLQFYLTGLYLLWIFTALALDHFARVHPRIGRIVVALVIAASLPSSLHYLARKWTDASRPPKASLSSSEVSIAAYLRGTDPETTVVLHDRPLSPSLMTIVAERRIVLGWDVRYSAVGAESRLQDVEAFFTSADGSPEQALGTLQRYEVTHLIVRHQNDRVHPDVLARLQPLMRFRDVSLYAVPNLR